MTECVILYRGKTGLVYAILGPSDEIAVYPHRDAAIAMLADIERVRAAVAPPLPVIDYQIVELDEL